MRIRTADQARANIGKRVYWDERSRRGVRVLSGVLEEVEGRNLRIDGEMKWMPDLKNLRIDEPSD